MIKEWLIGWLNKGTLKHVDKIELSIGIVYLKPLTNGALNRIRKESTVAGSILNDSYFFELMDYEMAQLSKKQIQNLSIKDGDKLRIAVKEILKQNNIIKIEGTNNASELSIEEVEIKNRQKQEVKKELNDYYKKMAEEKVKTHG